MNSQPYWGFNSIDHKAGTKLLNTFYVIADVRKDENGEEYHHYYKNLKLTQFSIEGWLNAIESGYLYKEKINYDLLW